MHISAERSRLSAAGHVGCAADGRRFGGTYLSLRRRLAGGGGDQRREDYVCIGGQVIDDWRKVWCSGSWVDGWKGTMRAGCGMRKGCPRGIVGIGGKLTPDQSVDGGRRGLGLRVWQLPRTRRSAMLLAHGRLVSTAAR